MFDPIGDLAGISAALFIIAVCSVEMLRIVYFWPEAMARTRQDRRRAI